MKIVPKNISKAAYAHTFNDLHMIYLESVNSDKNVLLIGKAKKSAEPDVLKDLLLEKYAYASALLYFTENFNIEGEINLKDLSEDINTMLHSRCKVVNEKAPLLTKIKNYPIYEGTNYILRGEGERKIKESFNLKEDVNIDDITLDYIKNNEYDDIIKDFIVCPKCKNIYEDEALIPDYRDYPDDYNGPIDNDPISYTCPYCGYHSTTEDSFSSAWIQDLEDAPNADEYVPGLRQYIDGLNESEDLSNKSIEELHKELDRLIAKNATDSELNDFLEKASMNERISNKEYTELVNKAQDTRRIDEDGTQAADIASKVDYSFQSAPTMINKKYKPVEIKELDENTYLNLNGFIKDIDGFYKRGNYVLVKESATGNLKVIHKNKINEDIAQTQARGYDVIVKYIEKKLNEKFPDRFKVKSGKVDDAYGIVITDNNNHSAGDLIDVTDFINSIMDYLGYDKSDYEIDYKRNNLIMAIYNDKFVVIR